MVEDTTEPEVPTPNLLLDEFLKEYYHLFVLVGVFGGIGAYLSSIQTQGIYGDELSALLDIGIAASLILVVIMSVYVDFVFVFSYTDRLGDPTAVFSKKTVLLAFFLVPFNVLVFTIVVAFARIEQIYFLVTLFSFVGGILVYGTVSPWLFDFLTRQTDSEGSGFLVGLVGFGMYNVVVFAGAVVVLSASMERFSDFVDVAIFFSTDYTTAGLLYFVLGLGIMPVVMLLGLFIYLFYYRVW